MQQQNVAIKVGVWVFILICLSVGLILWKSQFFLKNRRYEVKVKFENIGGLLKGADVRYRGYNVGRVQDIRPLPDGIVVYLEIDKDVKIPISSLIKIKFDGIVGETYISIVIVDPNPPFVNPGDTLNGTLNADFSNLIDISSRSMVHAEFILSSVRKIMGSEELSGQLTRILNNFDQFSAAMNHIAGKVDRQLDEQQLKEMLINFHRLSETLNKSSQQLLADGKVVRNIRTMTENLRQLSERLKETSDPETLKSLQNTIKNFEKISQSLNGFLSDSQSFSDDEEEGSNILKIISQLKIKNHLDLLHSPESKSSYYQVDTVLRSNQDFLKIGLTDRYQNIQLSQFQYGRYLKPSVVLRAGLFYQKPGAAIDVNIMKKNTLSISGYDLNKMQFEVQNRYHVLPNMDLILGLRPSQAQQTQLDAGFSYKF